SWTVPGNASTDMPPHGSCAASPDGRGSPSASVLTPCDTPSLLLRSTPEFPCGTSKKRPATPTRAPPCSTTEDANLSTVTPPTSWPRSSPAPRADLYRSGVRAQAHVGARAPDRAFCALKAVHWGPGGGYA